MASHPADHTKAPPVERNRAEAAETRQLLHRIRLGDASALDGLLAVYWKPLVRYAYALLGSKDDAEDVVQDVFVELWNRRLNWRDIESIRPYLYRSTRNRALNERRRRKVRIAWFGANRHEQRHPPTPAETLQTQELQRAVEAALASLSPRRREVFLLYTGHSLSYHEIGAIMGISYQTVANHMSAALRDLRRALAEYAGRAG